MSQDCRHEWVEVEKDPNSELYSVWCTKCGIGANVSEENLDKFVKRNLE